MAPWGVSCLRDPGGDFLSISHSDSETAHVTPTPSGHQLMWCKQRLGEGTHAFCSLLESCQCHGKGWATW